MSDDRHERLKAIFLAVEELPAGERDRRLAEACAGDDALRTEVDELLAAHDGTGEFLTRLGLPPEAAAEVLAGGPTIDDRLPPIPHPATASAEPVPERIGRYRILRLLGEGGMGRVYEAEQEQPARRVALKVLRQGLLSAAHRQRFIREIEILGRLRHPGIAQVYEAGTAVATYATCPQHEIHYFTMELIDGVDLLRYAERSSCGIRERLGLLASIADAAHHGHQVGIIHRDLKPANILVTSDGRPKIIDFGVARVIDPAAALPTLHTETGGILGTLAYLSPEQLRGEAGGDVRSDIYSLGVIGFEFLSGRLPFEWAGRSILEIARTVNEEEPISLGAVAPRLAGDVSVIIAKAIAKDPEIRYAAASELATDLRRHLENRPILARPPSGLYWLRKFARRHRTVVAAAALLLVAIIGGAVSTSVGLIRALRAERMTREESLRRQRVGEVLGGLLAYARPGMAEGGRDVRVVEMLHEASAGLSERLADVPEVELEVREVIAGAYSRLGLIPEAIDHYERAHELAATLSGSDSLRALDLAASVSLQRSLVRHGIEGDDGVAEEWARSQLELACDSVPADHAVLQRLRLALARLLVRHWRLDEAEEQYRALLQGETIETAILPTARAGLAFVLLALLRPEEAEAMLELALSPSEPEIGADWGLYDCPENVMADVHRFRGRREEAAESLERTLRMQRTELGENHPSTVSTKHRLVQQLIELGRYEHTLPLLREMRRFHESREPGDAWIGYLWRYEAHILVELGRGDEAGAAFAAAQAILAQSVGPDHRLTRENWCTAELSLGLRALEPWASEALRSHVFPLFEDALMREVPAQLERGEIDWARLTFELERWTGSSSGEATSGRLERVARGGWKELREIPDPDPGLYRLGAQVPRSQCADMDLHTWILMSPCELEVIRAYRFAKATDLRPRLATGDRERRSIGTLALRNSYCHAYGPFGAELNFELTARCTVDLPPGGYRLRFRSDDGAIVHWNDLTVIDRWTIGAGVAEADVEASGGPQRLEVEHFQHGGDARLWLELIPETFVPGR